ncbi:TonB-dependent receptor plug domain-containing protein [Actibacterium sp. D379-3]
MTVKLLATTATGALLTALAAPATHAQEVILLDKITASANLEDTDADRSGPSVVIVTEEELDQTAETRVVDYLARLPGISVRSRGPLGGQTGLTIRGVSQTNIAVRVDGIDVSDPSGPQVAFDFGSLTTMDISRIEVLKGSQSALYGSEAIGGVIDITTKRATRDGVEQSVGLEYGSYDTVKGSYSFAARGADHELAFTLSHIETDGYSAADENDGNTEEDGFSADRFSFYGEYVLDNGVKFIASGFYEDAEYDYDESGPVDGTPDEVTANLSKGLRGAVQFATGAVDHEVELAWFDIDRELTGTNMFGPFEYDYVGERRTIGYRGATDLGAAARLVFGAQSVEETYENDFGFGSSGYDSTVNSAFGEVSFAPSERADVTATLRYDDHSEFGDYVTGRLAGVYRAREDLLFRASLANGFRAPSNYELYDVYSGNPDLDPETSVSAEIGVEKRYGDRGVVKATAFYIEAEDLIDYSYTTYTYVQADGKTRRSGLELSGAWSVTEEVELAGAYTYTDSSGSAVLDSSSWLTSTPRHLLSLAASYDVTPVLNATLTALHGADRAALPDMTVFDAAFTYAFDDSTAAYLRVENLFDEEYQVVPGYGTTDRAFYVGLRKSF